VSTCPSCKKSVSSSDVVCPHCRHPLDQSQLGDDLDRSIVDDDGVFGSSKGQRDLSFGDDAVIFGDGVGDYDAFDAVDTGFVQKELTNARIYVGGATQNLMRADAIPERVKDASVEDAALTPYELHILQFVNGKRPVGRIRRKSGMEDPDVKLAIAMLADKRLIRLAGHVSEDRKLAAREKRRTKLKAEKAKKREGRSKSARSVDTSVDEKTSITPPPPLPSAERKRPTREPKAPTRITRSEGGSLPSPDEETARRRRTRSGDRESAENKKRRSAEKRSSERAKADDKKESITRVAPQLRSLDVGLDDDAPGAFGGDTEVSLPSASAIPLDARDDGDKDVADAAFARARDDDDADGFDDEGAATALRPSLDDEGDRDDPAAADSLPDDAARPPTGASLDDDGEQIHREVTQVKRAPLPDEPGADRDDDDLREEDARDDDEPLEPEGAEVDDDDVREAPVGPVPLGDAVHDVPTGPLSLKLDVPSGQHGRGFDDSVVPTGEVPVLSISGFPNDDAAARPSSATPPPLPDDDDEQRRETNATPEVISLPSDFITPLPPAALTPLPGTMQNPPPVVVAQATTSPAPTRAPTLLPLPGQAPALPGHAPALPGQAVAAPAQKPALPGQAPPGAKLPPAPTAPPPKPDDDLDDAIADDSDEGEARDAGAAPVSYENRRKAEKIFEQAERDATAGRFASARMNAKLAMIYDPSLKRYRELYELWGSPAAQSAQAAQRKDVQLFQQAKDLELKGDFKGAVRLLEQALKLNPTAAPILNLLGVIQATRLKLFKAASDNLMKACELEPGNRSFKNNLGKVLGMAEDARDKRVVDNDEEGAAVKVKKMRPKLF